MTNDFSDWLQSTLDSKNMKPVQLARKANIDPGVISRILSRERRPSPETLEAIAHALQMPVDLIFEKAGILPPKTELTPNKRELMEKLKTADDATVKMVIEILEAAVRNKQREIPNNINPKTTPR